VYSHLYLEISLRLIYLVRHLRSADHIIALGQKGNVVEQGTFAELDSKDGYLRSLAIAEAKKEDGESTDVEKEKFNTRAVTAHSQATTTGDDARRLGDFSVYNYYRKAITTWRLLLFVGLEAISIPSYRFIRGCLHNTFLLMLTSIRAPCRVVERRQRPPHRFIHNNRFLAPCFGNGHSDYLLAVG
jgi:hypothetical protein